MIYCLVENSYDVKSYDLIEFNINNDNEYVS